eukprot:CAMPEP_0114687902 /NCGR_PEP_ID=MMETSP0191-20121206/62959_1 /TAXON_ID=126664 /ORGANISM="Sorites sp." /LENGTH=44 /DNA_ID= /DNA_START= /DNA_END= /DNA_ORIENTATION=
MTRLACCGKFLSQALHALFKFEGATHCDLNLFIFILGTTEEKVQ